ncbi:MAG TPA: hypothetical protein VGW38_08965 [Chloroflexota bacterium]|nr:hypothetical protein [Chloroflexota bacterium]
MARHLRYQHHWIFSVAALAVWLASGWPVLEKFMSGGSIRGAPVSALWFVPFMVFQVTSDGEGVRLVARNDGSPLPTASSPGTGLLGMRERVESLGGKLAVRTGVDFGFMVDAWLPARAPQTA